NGGGRLPVVGGGDHERVDGLVVERAPEVAESFYLLALRLAHGGGGFGEDRGIHVAHAGDLGVARLGECLCQHSPAAVQAHHADDDFFAGGALGEQRLARRDEP